MATRFAIKPQDIQVGEHSLKIWNHHYPDFFATAIVRFNQACGDGDWIGFSLEDYERWAGGKCSDAYMTFDSFADQCLLLKSGKKYFVTQRFLNAVSSAKPE